MANQIMYAPAALREALDRCTAARGVKLSALLHELTAFVELAADRAAKKAAPPAPVTAEDIAAEAAP